MATITFKSSDEQIFTVPLATGMFSSTVRTMIDDLGEDNSTESSEIIPLPNVTGSILEKVLEWAAHEQNEPTARNSDQVEVLGVNDSMTKWEQKYLEIDDDTLYALIRAANYLDVKGLLELTCLALANKMKGKSSRELRELFGLTWPTIE